MGLWRGLKSFLDLKLGDGGVINLALVIDAQEEENDGKGDKENGGDGFRNAGNGG
jgi:hypothetical protein